MGLTLKNCKLDVVRFPRKFRIANPPENTSNVMIFYNGKLLIGGSEYTQTDCSIVTNFDIIPGEELYAVWYEYDVTEADRMLLDLHQVYGTPPAIDTPEEKHNASLEGKTRGKQPG